VDAAQRMSSKPAIVAGRLRGISPAEEMEQCCAFLIILVHLESEESESIGASSDHDADGSSA
jgi:hypothetical protein